MFRPALTESEPAWGQAESLFQPRRAAFWLFAALFAIGAVMLSYRASPALGIDIGATSLALVLWALYAAPFVALTVQLDLLEPEPPPFLAAAFAWGAVVAVSIAIVANSATQSILAKTAGAEFTRRWWPALSGPSTEEVLKVLGVVVVVLIARTQLNTLLDGLVYGLFIGLGFQVAENFLYTADGIQTAVFNATPGRLVLDLFVLRGLGLGLWSHAVYTAIAGVGVAYAVLRTDKTRLHRCMVAGLLFIAAWSLHFLWNAPFFQPTSPRALAMNDLGLYIAKGAPAVLLAVILYVAAHRREVAWFDDVLREEPADVSLEELEALSTRSGRKRAREADRAKGGRVAAAARVRLQQAQVRLAVACVRAGNHAAPAVEAARREVRAARAELQRTLRAALTGSENGSHERRNLTIPRRRESSG
jgi:RsiW-degrading membrane proteinase PrsW (M82 family)